MSRKVYPQPDPATLARGKLLHRILLLFATISILTFCLLWWFVRFMVAQTYAIRGHLFDISIDTSTTHVALRARAKPPVEEYEYAS